MVSRMFWPNDEGFFFLIEHDGGLGDNFWRLGHGILVVSCFY